MASDLKTNETNEKLDKLANILENNLDKKRKDLCSASSDDSVLGSPEPVNKKSNQTIDLELDSAINSIEPQKNKDHKMSNDDQFKKLQDSMSSMNDAITRLATRDDVKQISEELGDRVQRLASEMYSMHKALSERLDKNTEEFEGRMFQMEDKISKLCKENNDLNSKVTVLQNRLNAHDSAINDAEQYTRRWNLRLFNVKDDKNETEKETLQKTCEIFNNMLKINVDPNDIECCHRIGVHVDNRRENTRNNANSQNGNIADGDNQDATAKPKTNYRSIIVRFKDRGLRDRILAVRKELKGKDVSLSEDLTQANAKLSRDAFKHKDVFATWTINGKVFAKLQSQTGPKIHIPFGCEVNEFIDFKVRNVIKH